jgi:molybdopterin converting factor small subunit
VLKRKEKEREENRAMETIVRIPTPLRTLTGGADEVTAAGNTLAELIEDLERKHPGIRDRLLDEKGVRRFVNIYVGEEDVRFLDGLKTTLKAGDQVSIVPAIAGG